MPRRTEPEPPEVVVRQRGPRDIAIDVTGVVVVRCIGLDAFDRAARLFCEVEACDPWVESAGRIRMDFPRHEPGAEGGRLTADVRGVRKRGRSESRTVGRSASTDPVHSEGPTAGTVRAL